MWFAAARSAAAIAELARRYPSPSDFAVVDVGRDAEVRAWANRVLADGPPDLLVNNAALINRNARLWEVPEEEFSRVVDVNIKGVVNVLRHFLPAMETARAGCDCQLQFRLGTRRFATGGAVLRHKMGHRRAYPRPGRGTSRRHGRRAAESRHHQHRDAANLLGHGRQGLSPPFGLGEASSAHAAATGTQG